MASTRLHCEWLTKRMTSAVGDKDMFDGTILAKATDAIVVVMNYRIGAFGWSSRFEFDNLATYLPH